ncbi:signal recognition particle-docking protein FtsY [Limnofasciculus baicalensis]|uniref:Signal recognition particle receptor FtsY n=1 Tax=Limnofasciculus baicalensis BBK-W-15 TaxID=2699891 RepID=A0AAE3GYW5_9CYAN|nr:signal recognition particle-docking protein FtsY [Limnofasciculus baicalensis]MCP2732368.1 signal recognition particle-docking protein FtsY [Limnofasciculus baicalensis BBK-W-15]
MVFNWFRRQFGNKEESTEENLPQTPAVEPEEKVTEESKEEESTTVADDYLSWAKAAYKNIQKQQQPSEEATPEEGTESPEVSAVQESEAQPETEEASIAAGEILVESEAIPKTETESEVVEVTDVTEVVTETESEAVESAIATPAFGIATPALGIPSPEVEASITDTESEVAEVTQPEIEVTEVESEAVESAIATPALGIPSPEVETSITDTESEVAEVTQPDIEVTEEILAVPLSTEAETQTEVPVTEIPESTVPIWARKADREERLKRLEATAVEISTTEPVKIAEQSVAPAIEITEDEEEEDIPDVNIDEGFLWSAKVLASQGRNPDDVSAEEINWLKRLREGLGKTRRGLVNQLKGIVGQGPLNKAAVMEIEALLLQADVGVEATDYIIKTLEAKISDEVLPSTQAIAYLKQILRDLLDKPCEKYYTSNFFPEKNTLNIWLMTGVNGVGKTTTIGKLAHLANKSGYSCLIGAADTFRAAAVEQVRVWGERSGTEVIANPGKNTDPAAVVFDAIAAAQSRNTELLLVDTAGRLQNKKNLMEELAKIRRIVDKKAPNAKVESLLVLDATLGQNGLRQAEVFAEAAKLSGVVLTKLDGTAKGGVALAVVQQLGLPIRFIGAGEGIEDLRPFSSYEFVEALLSG